MSVLTVDHNFATNESSRLSNVPLSIEYMFFATGDFGGGCLELEASPDNGVTWFTVDALTCPGRLIRYLVSGEKVKLTLLASTNPNINAGIRQ
tara:strand:- start:1376 stop:1654 length:279 start_codon:yes stop_codon:yes gene_type:complete